MEREMGVELNGGGGGGGHMCQCMYCIIYFLEKFLSCTCTCTSLHVFNFVNADTNIGNNGLNYPHQHIEAPYCTEEQQNTSETFKE